MPRTTAKPIELTADEAMEPLGLTTRQGVAYLIRAGKLPGARKLQDNKRGSPWIIPVESIEAYVQEKEKAKQKRAQAAMA